MARFKAYRKYQLTINNPVDKNISHEQIKQSIGTFSNCLYWCMADEVGENGTSHTHVYLTFRNTVEFSAIKQRFYEAHIEGAQGSNQENRDYIKKKASA